MTFQLRPVHNVERVLSGAKDFPDSGRGHVGHGPPQHLQHQHQEGSTSKNLTLRGSLSRFRPQII